LAQKAERGVVDGDMQLVSGRLVERSAPVGADLGADAEVAQERECPSRAGRADEVELHGDRPVPQMPGARGMEERRQLCEPAAAPRGDDLRELVAEVLGERHSEHHAFELEQPALVVDAFAPPAADAAGADDAVDRQEGSELAARAERPRGTRCTRSSRKCCELAIRDGLAARNLPQLARARSVETARELELHVAEVIRCPLEPRLQPPDQTLK